MNLMAHSLVDFAKLRKSTINSPAFIRFSWNSIFQYFTEICRECSCGIKIWQE